MRNWKHIVAYLLGLGVIAALFTLPLPGLIREEVRETTLILILVVVILELWRWCLQPLRKSPGQESNR